MIKLQFKLPQALISQGFTQRTVFHAPAFQQKGINRLMDIYQIWKPAKAIKTLKIIFTTPSRRGSKCDGEIHKLANSAHFNFALNILLLFSVWVLIKLHKSVRNHNKRREFCIKK